MLQSIFIWSLWFLFWLHPLNVLYPCCLCLEITVGPKWTDYRGRYRDHIAPVLRDLHWLPSCFLAQFRVLVHTFKALSSLGQVIWMSQLLLCGPAHQLRASSQALLFASTYRSEVGSKDVVFHSPLSSALDKMPKHFFLPRLLMKGFHLFSCSYCLFLAWDLFYEFPFEAVSWCFIPWTVYMACFNGC